MAINIRMIPQTLAGHLKWYALHYGFLFLVYAIMLGVIIFHLGTMRRRKSRHPTERERASARNRARATTHIPSPLLRVLLGDPYPLSFLESQVLRRALSDTGRSTASAVAAAGGRPHVDVVNHTLMESHSVRDTVSRCVGSDVSVTCRTCGVAPHGPRSGAVVYSLFGANDRRTGGIDRHVRDLRRRTGKDGVVVARVILRNRANRDAVLAQFEEHFEYVQYGFVNYALFCCVHVLTLYNLLWYELRRWWKKVAPGATQAVVGEEDASPPAWAEWWRYGQLIIVARDRMPGESRSPPTAAA